MTAQLKIRDLEMLIALHEEGNLTQAAKRVGVSEPALSKRLLLIERAVKARLFDRDHHGAAITSAGRSFVARIKESIHSFHCAVHEAQEAKQSEHHRIRIGASAFLSAELLELMRSIELLLYKDLSIEIVTEYSAELLAQLHRHQVDIAFVTSPQPSLTVTTLSIAKSPFMIVFRKGHPLKAKNSVTLSDVAEYPWVYFSRNVHPPLYDQILHRVEVEHRRANVVHQICSADQVPALLSDDRILAWLTPTGAQKIMHPDLISIPLRDEQIHLETHLATLANNKSQLVSEYVRTFVPRFMAQRPAEQLSLPMA